MKNPLSLQFQHLDRNFNLNMKFLEFMVHHYDIYVVGIILFYIIGLIDGRGVVGSITYAILYGSAWAFLVLVFFYITKRNLMKIF